MGAHANIFVGEWAIPSKNTHKDQKIPHIEKGVPHKENNGAKMTHIEERKGEKNKEERPPF